MINLFKRFKKKEQIQEPTCYTDRLDFIYVNKEMLSGASTICFCVEGFYNMLSYENKVEDNTMYFVYKNRKAMRVAYNSFINND